MSEQATRSPSSTYQRPTLPYRCGRSRTWDRPCWQGPDVSGECGGTVECTPARRGDRWECRRPNSAGGICHPGPLPDGRCSHTRFPCVPRVSLRKLRGRVTIVLCSFIIAMVGAFSGFISGSTGSANAIDPGPLSAVHASFTGSAGCSACHLAHDAEGYKWLTASFQSHDQTGQCLNCHEFDGHNRTAHNSMYPHQKSLPQPECASCHTEH